MEDKRITRSNRRTKWEPQKIKDYLEQKWDIPKLESEIEKLKWKPIKLKDFIEEASFPIDFKTHEGWLFEKLNRISLK